MDGNLVDHILAGLALVFGALAAWFARKAGKAQSRQSLEALVRDACDYATAHPRKGIEPLRVALDAARLGDIQADGKRDFTDEALAVALKAELARRATAK